MALVHCNDAFFSWSVPNSGAAAPVGPSLGRKSGIQRTRMLPGIKEFLKFFLREGVGWPIKLRQHPELPKLVERWRCVRVRLPIGGAS